MNRTTKKICILHFSNGQWRKISQERIIKAERKMKTERNTQIQAKVKNTKRSEQIQTD